MNGRSGTTQTTGTRAKISIIYTQKIKYIVPNNNGNWQRQREITTDTVRTAHCLIRTVSRSQMRACARSMRCPITVHVTTRDYYEFKLDRRNRRTRHVAESRLRGFRGAYKFVEFIREDVATSARDHDGNHREVRSSYVKSSAFIVRTECAKSRLSALLSIDRHAHSDKNVDKTRFCRDMRYAEMLLRKTYLPCSTRSKSLLR